MTLRNFLKIFIFQVLDIVYVKALGEACGKLALIGTINCGDGYHCCSPEKSTCCPNAAICIMDDTACLHLAAIIGPSVGVTVIIVSCILCCCFCRRRRAQQQGVVMQSGAPMVMK